ncbi:hypothetical protein, partial [Loigolactobacillus iwatensis]|uniref:hypothetical protein n=1 Tax=Loigolactobacillus iwatensis TaxID=1267156 RepID=UPI001CDCCC83
DRRRQKEAGPAQRAVRQQQPTHCGRRSMNSESVPRTVEVDFAMTMCPNKQQSSLLASQKKARHNSRAFRITKTSNWH